MDRKSGLRQVGLNLTDMVVPGILLAVAAVYGPIIWMVMSLVIIPLSTHRPPAINIRWWVQFFGHIPFVSLPIVALIGWTYS